MASKISSGNRKIEVDRGRQNKVQRRLASSPQLVHLISQLDKSPKPVRPSTLLADLGELDQSHTLYLVNPGPVVMAMVGVS